MSDESFWVIGYGGIGQAICTKLVSEGKTVTVLSRRHVEADGCTGVKLDYTDSETVADFVGNHPLPTGIIITTGILHDANHGPEKTVSQCTTAWLERNIEANVTPSLLLAKAINPQLKPSTQLQMVCLSARVGSIQDNRLGGWYSYRMSKAMLNMLIKTIAIEWHVKSPKSSIIGYHPGTVDTPLSAPYQAHVKEGKLFSPQQAADYFYEVLRSVTPTVSGQVLDWQGKPVPA